MRKMRVALVVALACLLAGAVTACRRQEYRDPVPDRPTLPPAYIPQVDDRAR